MRYLVGQLIVFATLIAPVFSQTPQPQLQVPPKVENLCAPRQEPTTERQMKVKVGRIVGGLLNKANQKVQKDTKGNAPVVTPDDLPKQAQTPCKAPAAVTLPPIAK